MNKRFIEVTTVKHLAGVLAIWMVMAVLGAMFGSSVVGGCQTPSVPTVVESSGSASASYAEPEASAPESALVTELPAAGSSPAPAPPTSK